MKIAVLSGKGGAGKTFVAVNLACTAGRSVYVDCDVEEPNGRLFLKPERVEVRTVNTTVPDFDTEKCSGCRRCVEFCRFNALLFIKKQPMVFSEVCHACGGCAMVCPEHAITEIPRPVGTVESGMHRMTRVVTGILNMGEASGIPVIRAALAEARQSDGPVVLDCPPGSACSVTESIAGADYCVLVAEPTAFGFHNFRMVHELVSLLGKPCGVVINKQSAPYEPLERFCREHGTPVLLRIPYRQELARLCSSGEIAVESDEEAAQLFQSLLRQIGGGVS